MNWCWSDHLSSLFLGIICSSENTYFTKQKRTTFATLQLSVTWLYFWNYFLKPLFCWSSLHICLISHFIPDVTSIFWMITIRYNTRYIFLLNNYYDQLSLICSFLWLDWASDDIFFLGSWHDDSFLRHVQFFH